MNEDRRAFSDEYESTESFSRFKASLLSGRIEYFDVADFEDIIDHLIDEGEFDNAEVAIMQAINMHPGSLTLRIRYVQSLLNNDKPVTALVELKLLEAIEDKNPEIYLLKGNAHLLLDEHQEASLNFRKAIEHAGPEADEINYLIGSAYVDNDDLEMAVRYFDNAWKANPKHEMALFDLAFYYDMLGIPEKSIEYYNHYLDLDPYNLSAWFNLGIAYNRTVQFEKAVEAYDYAILLYPEAFHAIFNKANSLANLTKYKEAIAAYREYLKFDKDNDDALCYIGMRVLL